VLTACSILLFYNFISTCTRWVKKRGIGCLIITLDKCESIFKILSYQNSRRNVLCTITDFHLKCGATLPCESWRFKNAIHLASSTMNCCLHRVTFHTSITAGPISNFACLSNVALCYCYPISVCLCTCISICIFLLCYSAILLLSREWEIKPSVSVTCSRMTECSQVLRCDLEAVGRVHRRRAVTVGTAEGRVHVEAPAETWLNIGRTESSASTTSVRFVKNFIHAWHAIFTSLVTYCYQRYNH